MKKYQSHKVTHYTGKLENSIYIEYITHIIGYFYFLTFRAKNVLLCYFPLQARVSAEKCLLL